MTREQHLFTVDYEDNRRIIRTHQHSNTLATNIFFRSQVTAHSFTSSMTKLAIKKCCCHSEFWSLEMGQGSQSFDEHSTNKILIIQFGNCGKACISNSRHLQDFAYDRQFNKSIFLGSKIGHNKSNHVRKSPPKNDMSNTHTL